MTTARETTEGVAIPSILIVEDDESALCPYRSYLEDAGLLGTDCGSLNPYRLSRGSTR